MDPTLWKQAQRQGFPYNVQLEVIVAAILVTPLAFIIFFLAYEADSPYYLKTVLQTIGWAMVGYFISDSLISAFKDTLAKKGLFGRDLNKAGIQREKKPV
jgi:hypothetical protein